MKYDYLVVGSGLFGATFAWFAHQAGKKCLVIEKRPHLGGNVFCEEVEGIHVHRYGPHILHTDDEEVWRFVTQFVPFNRFTNSPLANYKGKLYNLPFNMNTFRQMWGVTTPEEAMEKLDEQRAEIRERLSLEGVETPRNLEEQGLSLVGKDLFEKLIKEYSEKQWGRPCRDLPAFIVRRLPVRFTYDNNYFIDRFQGIPIGGYNGLIECLLADAECRCCVDFLQSEYRDWRRFARKLVYTGPLDAFFDHCFGALEWRTVRFETRVLDVPNYQGNAVVNYTSHDVSYTRVIEHKHFEKFGAAVYDNPKTVISEEFPVAYRKGMEPFYPVNDDRNNALYSKYKELAEAEQDVVFGGRLAEYKYYDMAPVIKRVIDYWKENGTL
ncbi:MAG: UDP-galactopyranose mutase [Bacteroidales bacterium]|nr:UDP-galactopyranose mutase [Bacteroidales bacterium]